MQNIASILQQAIALESQPSFDGDLDYQEPPMPAKADAAVMVMVNVFDAPSIVLTKRAGHLRKHAGQVAFPGGRVDLDDRSSWDAALRETNEEIGLPRAHPLERLGSLPVHRTITGFTVTPHIALNAQPFPYQPEAGEVEAVFEIPLFDLEPQNFRIDGYEYQGQLRRFYVLNNNEHYIWGATARILYQLAERLKNV